MHIHHISFFENFPEILEVVSLKEKHWMAAPVI